MAKDYKAVVRMCMDEKIPPDLLKEEVKKRLRWEDRVVRR
jgi:hypothetical protein